MQKLIRSAGCRGLFALAGVFFAAGCTPQDQPSATDALNMAAQAALTQAVEFAIGFARQVISAFLF